MSRTDPEATIYEVDPTKKFILVFDQKPTHADIERIKSQVEGWLNGDNPFLILSGKLRLVKVQSELDFWEERVSSLEEIVGVVTKRLLGEGSGQPVGILNPAELETEEE